jgi:nitrogen-specific signal transduction histidine kinase
MRKFVSLLAEDQWSLPKYMTLNNAYGFFLPPIETDRHHITEKLLSMAKNAK